MIQEIIDITAAPLDQPEPLPFPFNQRNFCRYEPIEKRIAAVRVLIVNDLLREETDISQTAREEWGASTAANLARERHIAGLALDNIISNVTRLVREPEMKVAHLSEIAEVAADYRPQAIVLSGTLSDFDYYHPSLLENFGRFIRSTRIPVLGICGGHQLIGLSFGARTVTLDNREPVDRRRDRPFEYQYRFIRITEPDDDIFHGIHDTHSGIWQDYTTEGRILRVWQNHGLQLDRVPDGFKLLATAYLCRNQMMVKRSGDQLIYTVQYHLEKSFQDVSRSTNGGGRTVAGNAPENKKRRLREEASNRTLWAHQSESRDGRIIFENFLREALRHNPSAD